MAEPTPTGIRPPDLPFSTFLRLAVRQTLAESGLGRGWRRLRERYSMPRIVLALAMLVWFIGFAFLVYRRHDHFGSFAYDLGIFDQTSWLLSRGSGFNTVRGLQTFGHHGSVGFFLLVPFYWLGAGPHFLNLLQVGAVVGGAIPVFLISRDVLKNEWYSLIPALAFMTHFSNQWMLQEQFHPEVLAITPLLFAYRAATRKRWLAYGLWLAFAVSWKEDVAIAAAVLGVVLWLRRERKAGLWTLGAAAAWFGFVSWVLIPSLSPGGVFYNEFFGSLGNTPGELLVNSITNPGEVLRRATDADFYAYIRDIGLPFAFTSFLSPLTLLIGVPQAVVNLLSVNSWTWTTRVHYVAIPLAAATIAMCEGLGRIRREAVLRFALGAIAALSVATVVSFGITPLSRYYSPGLWPDSNDRQAVMKEAVALPGSDDAVSATYNFVPYLTHRHEIYMFTNPFEVSYWGVAGENQRDPATVQWLVLDRRILGADPQAVLKEILGSGEWQTVLDDQDILVAHRVG